MFDIPTISLQEVVLVRVVDNIPATNFIPFTYYIAVFWCVLCAAILSFKFLLFSDESRILPDLGANEGDTTDQHSRRRPNDLLFIKLFMQVNQRLINVNCVDCNLRTGQITRDGYRHQYVDTLTLKIII